MRMAANHMETQPALLQAIPHLCKGRQDTCNVPGPMRHEVGEGPPLSEEQKRQQGRLWYVHTRNSLGLPHSDLLCVFVRRAGQTDGGTGRDRLRNDGVVPAAMRGGGGAGSNHNPQGPPVSA